MQDREIAVRAQDQADLFKELQDAKRKSHGEDVAYKMVADMMSAYPDEFDALLKKSREKKTSTTPLRKNSGWNSK